MRSDAVIDELTGKELYVSTVSYVSELIHYLVSVLPKTLRAKRITPAGIPGISVSLNQDDGKNDRKPRQYPEDIHKLQVNNKSKHHE